MKFNPYLHIAWITVCVTASSFLAGNLAIIMYFHLFEGFPYTLTGLVIADVLLMLAGTLGFVISCQKWYRFNQMIKEVQKRVREKQ